MYRIDRIKNRGNLNYFFDAGGSVAFGMQMGNSYRMTVLWSVLAAVGTTFLDCLSSYYWGTKPGGTIVLLEVACFVAALGIKGKEMGR